MGNGENISFSFSKSDFYHLLGFKKFTDVTIVKMIEAKVFEKKTFYDKVLKGEITYDKVNVDIKNMERFVQDDCIINFSDAVVTDKTSLVINNRFPYFTYDNMKLLLSTDWIILYDKDKAPLQYKLECDKFFSKLQEDKGRNLYFFIRKAKEHDNQCPVSFFLEQEWNSYIDIWEQGQKKEQEKVRILMRCVRDYNTNKEKEIVVYWDRVRQANSSSKFFRAQKHLRQYFHSTVYSSSLKIEIENLKRDKECEISLLNEREVELEIKNLIEEYYNIEDQERKLQIAERLLDEYYIDIMMNEKNSMSTRAISSIEQDILEIKKKITKLNSRIKKYQKYYPEIEQLEIEEVRMVYSCLWEDFAKCEEKFIRYLINDKNIYSNNMSSMEIRKEYKQWKQGAGNVL